MTDDDLTARARIGRVLRRLADRIDPAPPRGRNLPPGLRLWYDDSPLLPDLPGPADPPPWLAYYRATFPTTTTPPEKPMADQPPPPDRLIGAWIYDADDTEVSLHRSTDEQPELLWSDETVWGRIEVHGDRTRWVPLGDTPDPASGLTVRWTEDGTITFDTTPQEEPCQDL